MSDSTQDATARDGNGCGLVWNLANLVIGAGFALLAFGVYFLPAALGRPLSAPREARVAVMAREMLQSGNYVVPTLGGEAWIKEPPLPAWLAALSNAIFFSGNASDNLAMVRAAMFPPAASAALAVFLIIFFGCRFFDRRTGIMAGLILGVTLLAVHFAQSGSGDTTLMLACAGAICGMAVLLSEKPGLGGALVAGFSLGAGLLTSPLATLALIIISIIAEFVFRRKSLRTFNVVYIAMAFLIAMLVAAPWYMLVSRQQPGVVDAVLNTVDLNAHGRAYCYVRAAAGILPWTPILLLGFLVCALTAQFQEPDPPAQLGAVRFFSLYAGLGFSFFFFMPQAHESFLLPVLPALALSAGAIFSRLTAPGNAREENMGWSQLAIGVVGAVILGCAPVWPAILSGLIAFGFDGKSNFEALLAEVSAALGWLAIPLALGFFIVSFLCARFWAGGKGLLSISIFAALMFGFLIFAALRPAERDRHAAYWSNIEKLKKQTDALDPNTRIYAAGPGRAQMTFYTGKSVKELKDIVASLAPNPGRAAVIVPSNTTTLLGVDLSSAAHPVSDAYAIIDLPSDSPLEAALREAVSKKGTGEQK